MRMLPRAGLARLAVLAMLVRVVVLVVVRVSVHVHSLVTVAVLVGVRCLGLHRGSNVAAVLALSVEGCEQRLGIGAKQLLQVHLQRTPERLKSDPKKYLKNTPKRAATTSQRGLSDGLIFLQRASPHKATFPGTHVPASAPRKRCARCKQQCTLPVRSS